MDLDPKDPLVEVAVFGEQVRLFLLSEIGQYLTGRAANEAADAKDKLVSEAHTLSLPEILALQSKVWRGEAFAQWLGEALQDGNNALAALEAGE